MIVRQSLVHDLAQLRKVLGIDDVQIGRCLLFQPRYLFQAGVDHGDDIPFVLAKPDCVMERLPLAYLIGQEIFPGGLHYVRV